MSETEQDDRELRERFAALRAREERRATPPFARVVTGRAPRSARPRQELRARRQAPEHADHPRAGRQQLPSAAARHRDRHIRAGRAAGGAGPAGRAERKRGGGHAGRRLRRVRHRRPGRARRRAPNRARTSPAAPREKQRPRSRASSGLRSTPHAGGGRLRRAARSRPPPAATGRACHSLSVPSASTPFSRATTVPSNRTAMPSAAPFARHAKR